MPICANTDTNNERDTCGDDDIAEADFASFPLFLHYLIVTLNKRNCMQNRRFEWLFGDAEFDAFELADGDVFARFSDRVFEEFGDGLGVVEDVRLI